MSQLALWEARAAGLFLSTSALTVSTQCNVLLEACAPHLSYVLTASDLAVSMPQSAAVCQAAYRRAALAAVGARHVTDSIRPCSADTGCACRFDMFSVGILLLQMAFPSLRSDNNLVGQLPACLVGMLCSACSLQHSTGPAAAIMLPAAEGRTLSLLTPVQIL